MRILKSLKVAACSLVLGMSVAVSAIPASAQSVSDIEMKQVKEALEQYDEFLNDSTAYGDKSDLDISLDINNSEHNVYKSYVINNYIVDAYNDDFDSVISDEYRIVAESGNQLVTMINENGKLSVVDGKILNNDKKCVNFEEEATKIINQSSEKITELKFARCSPLYLDLIYFHTESDEFVVPYFDWMNDNVSEIFENGTIYPADEFIGRLNCLIDISKCDKPGEYGGSPFRAEPLAYSANSLAPESDSVLYIAGIILGFAVIASVGGYAYKKNRRNDIK